MCPAEDEVLAIPGVTAKFALIIAEGIGRGCCGARGIFPLGLGRQTIAVAAFPLVQV
jgi:hypothetical protein